MSSLLDEALAANGGLERWAAVAVVEAGLQFEGLAFAMRWNRRGRRHRRVAARAHVPETRFDDYPRPGDAGRFTAGRVELLDSAGGVRRARDRPREAFRSVRRALWWDDLDLLYFAGYAVWNYLTAPFLLARPGVRTTEAGTWTERGETWRRLEVSFPPDIPTHSSKQVYYFDADLRVRRLDYTAEVFARWADAAHYCDDHHTVDGITIPTRRLVVPRDARGHSRSGPALVRAVFDDLRLIPRAAVPE
jgi:hypothetical protein